MLMEYLIDSLFRCRRATIFTTLISNTDIGGPVFEKSRCQRLVAGMLMMRLLVSIAETPADQAEVLTIGRGEVGLEEPDER